MDKSLKRSASIFVIFMMIMFGCGSESEDVPEPEKDTIVYISSLQYGYHYQESELPLLLEGTALAFNGDFSNSISWESSIDGHLGIGRKLKIKLSPGTHTITATGDNGVSPGLMTTSITIDKDSVRKVQVQRDLITEVQDRDGATFKVNRTKGTILDTSTGLMWERNPSTYMYTYNEAVAYANKSSLGGYSDWRLPTKHEFIDIHNIYTDGREAILQSEFATFEGKFWSSTIIHTDSGYTFRFCIEQDDITMGWRNDFLSRAVNADLTGQLYVRLVRNSN